MKMGGDALSVWKSLYATNTVNNRRGLRNFDSEPADRLISTLNPYVA